MKKVLLFAFMALLFLVSCGEKGIQPNRSDFMQGDFSKIKDKYSVLSIEHKKILWIDKIDQLADLKISSEHNQLLEDLKQEILNSNEFNLQNADIKNIAIKLAEITPMNDYIEMFSTLKDYKFSGKFLDNHLCDICISDLQNESNQSNQNVLKDALPRCNCRWTCGDRYAAGTTSNCTQPASGCGFLWLSRCTGRDYLF